MRGLELFTALAFALSLSLAGTADAKPAPVKLSKPAAAEVTATADGLAGRIKNGRFPGVEERNPANGPAFLYLAATHPDPIVVAAALRAMSYTWRAEPRKGGKRTVMNADYVAVIKARLTDADGIVRKEALRAARLPLGRKDPDAAVLDALLAMLASENPGDQIAALTAVANVRAFARPRATKGPLKVRIIDAIMPLLRSREPAVVATALFRLNRSGYAGMPQAQALAGHSLRLAKHPEGAVRGEAMRLAATLEGKKASPKLVGRLMLGLGDKDPYARATAAELLAEYGVRGAVHQMMPLVDDEASAVGKVGGFRALDGRPGQQRFRAVTGSRVDDVALNAIDRLSEGVGSPLDCKVEGRKRKEARVKAKGAAKAWYADNKSKLPAAPK